MTASFLITAFGLVLVASILTAPRRASIEGFFAGTTGSGQPPTLWVLVLSQVTTWIFARSLMNAAILGYYYGFAGTLAYAAYYLSFLTGGFIVDRLRETGAGSVQDWLADRFGGLGTGCYNLIIALRLLSEVFANLLVIGLIFSALLPGFGTAAILVVAAIGFFYSAWGGLSAALRSDVLQMLVFLAVFGVAFIWFAAQPDVSFAAIVTAQGSAGSYNGWVLLLVAALQVFSYPAHDPVMMDRGFLADRATTRKSFVHAFWISAVLILGFGAFGIQAALAGASYEGELIGTWATMFPPAIFGLLMLSLLISAVSTLDSALASSARLAVDELRVAPRSLAGGRAAMAGFMVLGTVLTLWGNQSLFDAVAVSGTASMFLTPILVVGLVMGRSVALWSYGVAFAAAVAGALLYFARASAWAQMFLPEGHKYEQLLAICVVVLGVGFAAVLAGSRRVAGAPAA